MLELVGRKREHDDPIIGRVILTTETDTESDAAWQAQNYLRDIGCRYVDMYLNNKHQGCTVLFPAQPETVKA